MSLDKVCILDRSMKLDNTYMVDMKMLIDVSSKKQMK